MFESSLSRGGSPDPPEICVIRVSPLLAGTEAGPTKTIDRHTGRGKAEIRYPAISFFF